MRKKILVMLMAILILFNSEGTLSLAMNSSINGTVVQDSNLEDGLQNSEEVSQEVEEESSTEFVSEEVSEYPLETESVEVTEEMSENSSEPETTEVVVEEVESSEAETDSEEITDINRMDEEVVEEADVASPEDFSYVLSNDIINITGYLGTAPIVIIPSEIEEYPVGIISDSAFYGNTMITSVTIPDGVTYIGRKAFRNCTALTEVSFGSGLETIESQAFYNVPIESLAIPKGVTSIGDNAFTKVSEITFEEGMERIPDSACSGAGNLTKVTIPDTVTEIGTNAFYNCTLLKGITFGNELRSIGNSAFYGCKALEAITIPDSVASIGNSIFYNCTVLTEVSLGSGLETIGSSAFYNAPIESLTIPKGVTSVEKNAFTKVKEIIFEEGMEKIPDSVCYGAGNLTKVTIPDTVTEIGINAFYNCNLLEGITLGNELRSIGNSAFYGCKALEAIAIPDSVASIGNSIFYNCTALTEVSLGSGLETIGNSAFHGCKALEKIALPDSVTSIGNSAFYNCEALTEVSLGSGLETIGNNAFYNAPIESLTIPKGVTSAGNNAFTKVKEITFEEGMEKIPDSACSGAASLTKVTIPDSVTSIGNNAFYNCTILESVSIGDTLKTIGSYAFGYCKALKEITIPDSVTSIGNGAFYNCEALTEVSLGGGLETIGSSAFYNVPIESLTIPKGVASVGNNAFTKVKEIIFEEGMERIPDSACSGAGSLSKVMIPDSVTSIGNNAFYNCTILESVSIGDTLKTIGSYAFGYCKALKEIAIPDSVTSIGNSAFYNCEALTEVSLGSGLETIGSSAFNNVPMESVTIPKGVTSIGSSAFTKVKEIIFEEGMERIPDSACSGSGSLVKVTIPDSVTSIGNSAFYYCKSLTEVSLGSGLETIGSSAFYDVPIESVTIPKGVTSIGSSAFTKVKEIIFEEGMERIPDSACYGAISLIKVIIPSTITEIGMRAFYNCVSLEKIEIGNNVTVCDEAFRYCEAAKELIIGDDCVVGNRGFAQCSQLKKITVGKNVIFGEEVFQDVVLGGACTETVSWAIDIDKKELIISGVGEMPNYTSEKEVPWNGLQNFWDTLTIKDGVTSIGSYAFAKCNNIEGVIIPKDIRKIGEYAFYECSNLVYVELSKGISEVGKCAFANCNNLQDIVFCGDAPVFAEECLPDETGMTIYYPETGTGWIDRIFGKFTTLTWSIWDDTVPTNDIVLVLDTSGSMSGKMDELKESSIAFLEGIGGRLVNTRVAVVEYNTNAKVISGFSTNKIWQKNKIRQLESTGGTQYVKALNSADSILQSSSADFRTIVMFSDGEPGESEQTIYTLAEKLRKNYQIYTVGLLDSDRQKEIMINVAGSESHYFEANDINGLLQAFMDLISNFGKTEYTTVELKRHDNRYDLLKEEHAFCVNSPEEVSIYVTPGTKYENVVSIAVEQDGKEILSSETGIFENILPGSVFAEGKNIVVVLYDKDGNPLESLPLMIDMRSEFIITYNMNDGFDTVYMTDAIINGIDIEEPAKPTRDGYTFKGWYSTKECTGVTFFSIFNYFNRIKIEDDMTLYAKWKRADRSFIILDDAWSFLNSQNPFHCSTKEMTDADYRKLTDGLDSATKGYIDTAKSTWNGSCFGMSSSAVLMFANVIQLMDFDSNFTLPGQVTTLFHNKNGDADVGSIESMISYYQLRQQVGNIASIRGKYSGSDESPNIKQIIEKLEKSKYPVVFTISLYSGTSCIGGHAVVAYDLSYDESNSTYTFYVYDCSMGNGYNGNGKEYVITVTKNGDTYTKACSDWETDWGYTIFFKTALTEAELQTEAILTAPNVIAGGTANIQEVEAYILRTEYTDFSISDGSNNAVIENGVKVSGNLDIICKGTDSEIGAIPEYTFLLPVLGEGECYTIESQANGNFNTNLLYSGVEQGFFSLVKAETAGTVTISPKGNITTEYEEKTNQIITIVQNDKSTPWYNVTFEGEDTGFKAESDAEKMSISSNNKTNINICVRNDFNNVCFENIEVDNLGVTIEEGDNGECIITKSEHTVASKEFGYSVIFDSQRGTTIETLVNIPKDATIEEPKDPQRDGYIFEGWYKEKECENPWDFDTDRVTEDMVLYAGWSIDENYFVAVTFKIPGCDDQKIYLPRYSQLEEDKCPSNTVNEDVKWYKEETYINEWDYINDIVTENVTLYGKGKNCIVSFETGCDTTIDSFTTYAGKYLDVPEAELQKDGYTLCGWTTDPDRGTEWKFDTDKVSDDMTLYARWVANERDKTNADTKICIDIIDQNAYVFTGKAIKPQVVVRDGNTILEEGKDYKVSYKNNVNACDATDEAIKKNKKPQVVVEGINAYKAEKKFVKYFSINPVNMADLQIDVPSYVATKTNNKLQKVKPVVKTARITVSAENYVINYYSDMELTNKVNGITNEGIYYIVVEAAKRNKDGNYIGNYFGSASPIEVNVLSKNVILSNAKISANKEVECIDELLDSDEVIRKLINKVTVANKTYKTQGTDIDTFKKLFEITAIDTNGKKISQKELNVILATVGTKKVILRAKKDNDMGYVGETSVNIAVKGKKISKNQFTLTYDPTGKEIITSTDYVGKALVPVIVSELVANEDYSISYRYNKREISKSGLINAGTYTAVITGINMYSGKIELKFTINKINIADAYQQEKLFINQEETAVYSAKGVKVPYVIAYDTGRPDGYGNSEVQLEEGKDYSLNYANNKKVTSGKSYAHAVIKGKGNYTGSLKGDGKSLGNGLNKKKGFASELNFAINKKSLSSEDITVVVNGINYKKNAVSGVKFTLYDNGKEIPKKEYSTSVYSYGDSVSLYIYAKNISYKGSRSLYMSGNLIKTNDAKKVKISFKNNQKYYYSGEQIMPEILIKNVSGDDIMSNFIIEYGENTKVGIGTIKVTGKLENGYCQSKTIKFTIWPKWMQWLF